MSISVPYCIHGYFCGGFIFASQSSENFHFNIWLFIVMKTSENRKIKPSQISPPIPKSRKYLYAKYMAYTVNGSPKF